MSFLDIKDPKEREKIVADYLRTRKNIQQRNEDEKVVGLMKHEELKTVFEPIVEAQRETTKSLQELKPKLDETTTRRPIILQRKRTWTDRGESPLDFYEKANPKYQDKYYGIVRDVEGRLTMGNKQVSVDRENNIHVDDTIYNGTPGLWSLIMEAVPQQQQYTEKDRESFKKLIEQTDLMNHPHNTYGRSRPRQTTKYRLMEGILQPKEGSGTMVFLPGDIKGLQTKLGLLLAEYRAGNTGTRNQIVSILDELLRRKRISRVEYNTINKYLSA